MTVIRPNSITGINSITAQGGTVEFYDPAGNTITIQANVSGNIDVVSGILTTTTLSATTVNATTVNATTLTGDGSSLTGIDATSLKDSGGNIKVQANASGSVTTGVATVTSQITVGDSFIKYGSVGLGTTTTAGRTAGVGTATGTIVYDADLQAVQVYNGDGDGWGAIFNAPFNATGGTIDTSTFTGYKVHIFTTPGTLEVVSGTATADVLVVGGGGGGGAAYGGGGGAGAYRTASAPLSSGSYTVTVGAGGLGNPGANAGSPLYPPAPGAFFYPSTTYDTGAPGGDSVFDTITAPGGGGGGARANAGGPSPGGSGGGGGDGYPTGGLPGGPSGAYGNDGGGGSPSPTTQHYSGGGGGGAGAVGTTVSSTAGGPGGNGSNTFTYVPPAYGTPGPAPGRWFAGGGGGGNFSGSSATTGGAGGGAAGGTGSPLPDREGDANTGGGGGGGPDANPQVGGNGGSGIVIVAYPTA